MNRFFTLLLAASCLTAVGQVDVDYPYNPDNGDGLIGSPDLLELLTLYGTLFEPEALLVNEIPFQDWVDSVNNTLLSQQALIDSLMGSGVNQTDPCEGLTSVNYHGVEYPVVAVGDQCWFAKDLVTDKYNDGTPINDHDPVPWESYTSQPYIIYDITMIEKPLFVAVGEEGDQWGVYAPMVAHENNIYSVCPSGWKVPSLHDWRQLHGSAGGCGSAYTLVLDVANQTAEPGFNARPNWRKSWAVGLPYEWSPNWTQEVLPGDLYGDEGFVCPYESDLRYVTSYFSYRCEREGAEFDESVWTDLIAQAFSLVEIEIENLWQPPSFAQGCSTSGWQLNNFSQDSCDAALTWQEENDPRSLLRQASWMYCDYETQLLSSSFSSRFPLISIGFSAGGHAMSPFCSDEIELQNLNSGEYIMLRGRAPIRCIKDTE